jgi:hypothetical protein
MSKNKPSDFEESYKNTMEFSKQFSLLIPLMGDDLQKKQHLNIENVLMTSSNFILGVGHKKCGCPGIVNMIFNNGDWVCPSCSGWVSEKEAKNIMKKEYADMINTFSKLTLGVK